MKYKFRQISALATTGLLLGMSFGFAAAANYPSPFVVGSSADVGIVYGTGTGVLQSDLVQSAYIQGGLADGLGTTGTAADTISGEAYPLFSSSDKIWMNEAVSVVRDTLTKTELPTVLADSSFDGDVSADITQTIEMGTYPKMDFGQHPTSEDDPVITLKLSETANGNYLYNMTFTFDQAVNLTHADSIGESFTIFGKKYTVGADTVVNKLYLYESTETVSLGIGGTAPSSATVTVGDETFTVTLMYAEDTKANIQITNAAGVSDSKEVNEDDSKKINGIDVAVGSTNEAEDGTQVAEVTVGSNKILLKDGNKVKVGSDEDSISGTYVNLGSGASAVHKTTNIEISVSAEDADVDALLAGESFIDPVFGSFKIDFASVYSDDNRETITISGSSSDKANLEMTTHDGSTGKIIWYNNASVAVLSDTTNSDNIYVLEQAAVSYTEYVMVGNEDEGFLLEFYEYDNDSDNTDDTIKFRNVFDHDDQYTVTGIAVEGTGTLTVGGKSHTVVYSGASSSTATVRINMKDSDGGNLTIFPTIETSKGANLGFYNMTYIPLSNIDGAGTDLAGLLLPDGAGYKYVPFAYNYKVMKGETAAGVNETQWLVGGKLMNMSAAGNNGTLVTVGQLKYWINGSGVANTTLVQLTSPQNGAGITNPAIVIFEEEDDNDAYEAIVVTMENAKGGSSTQIGVADVQTTYMDDAGLAYTDDWDDVQEETDDKIYHSLDLWGTHIITDQSDSDQYDVVINYPDEQIAASIYVAEVDATISGGSTGAGTLGNVLYKDTEVSSASTKNLIVVGGSCINSAAAALVGGALCGAAWEDATGVGSGQFLIESYGTSTITSKIAVLVAGYDAADTVNAATYLRTQAIDLTAGNKFIGTTASSATLQVA